MQSPAPPLSVASAAVDVAEQILADVAGPVAGNPPASSSLFNFMVIQLDDAAVQSCCRRDMVCLMMAINPSGI